MAKTVEFFSDFGSPYSYLAYKALPGIAAAPARAIPGLAGPAFMSRHHNFASVWSNG